MHRYDRADPELAGERNALQARPPGSDSVRAVTGSGFRRSRLWHSAISVYSNEVGGSCNGSRRAGRRRARQQPRAGCRCRPVACDGGRGCDAGSVPGAGGARVTRASAPGRSRCGPQGGSVHGNQDERSTGAQASGATSPGGQRSTGGACVAGTRRSRLVAEVSRRRRAEIARIVRRMPSADRQAAVAALQAFADAAGEVPEQDWSLGWDLGE